MTAKISSGGPVRARPSQTAASATTVVAKTAFAVTAVSAAAGTVLQSTWAATHVSVIPAGAGFTTTFGPGLEGLLNDLSFFTTWSSLFVACTCLPLALPKYTQSGLFHAARIVGLIDIAITGIVFNLLIAGDTPTDPLFVTASLFQHTLTPLLAWASWLVFGPFRAVTLRRIVLAALVPLLWVALTLVRGVFANWYPYGFIDVTSLGYPQVALNIVFVIVVWCALAGIVALIDARRSRRLNNAA